MQRVAIKPLSVAVPEPKSTAVSFRPVSLSDLHVCQCPPHGAASPIMLNTYKLPYYRSFAGSVRHPCRRLVSSILGNMD